MERLKVIAYSYLPFYIIYLAFIEVTVAHSIIASALATLYGYQLYLSTLESNKFKKELAVLQSALDQRVGQIKEATDAEFSKLRDEVSKVAITASRLPPSSSPAYKNTDKLRF